MPNPLPFLALLSVSALACIDISAQISIRGEIATTAGVYAEEPPAANDQKSLPAFHQITSPVALRASSGNTWTELRAGISGSTASILLQGAASGSTYPGGASGVFRDPVSRNGSPRIRFIMRSARPVTGRIIVKVTLRGDFSFGGIAAASATATVNGVSSTVDEVWPGGVTKNFAARLDPLGTSVNVDVWGAAFVLGPELKYSAKVEISFEEGHEVTNYGDNCAHVHAEFPSRLRMELAVGSNLPNADALLLLGNTRTWLYVSAWCDLLVDPFAVVALPVKTDATGHARTRLTIPNQNFPMLIQMAIYSSQRHELELTDGLDIRFHKR